MIKINSSIKLPYIQTHYYREISITQKLKELEGRFLIILAYNKDFNGNWDTSIEEFIQNVFGLNPVNHVIFINIFKKFIKNKTIHIINEKEIDNLNFKQITLGEVEINQEILKNLDKSRFVTFEEKTIHQDFYLIYPAFTKKFIEETQIEINDNSTKEDTEFSNISVEKYKKEDNEINGFIEAKRELPDNQITVKWNIESNKIINIKKEIKFLIDNEFTIKSENEFTETIFNEYSNKEFEINWLNLLNSEIFLDSSYKTVNNYNEYNILNKEDFQYIKQENKENIEDQIYYEIKDKFYQINSKNVIFKLNDENIEINSVLFKKETSEEWFLNKILENNLNAIHSKNIIKKLIYLIFKENLIKKYIWWLKEQNMNLINDNEIFLNIDYSLIKEFLNNKDKLLDIHKLDAKTNSKWRNEIFDLKLDREEIYNHYNFNYKSALDNIFFKDWNKLKEAQKFENFAKNEIQINLDNINNNEQLLKDRQKQYNEWKKIIYPINVDEIDLKIEENKKQLNSLFEKNLDEIKKKSLDIRQRLEKFIIVQNKIESLKNISFSSEVNNLKIIDDNKKNVIKEIYKKVSENIHYKNNQENNLKNKYQSLLNFEQKMEQIFKEINYK